MLRGIVFDIREFAVHDGPGLRTTVCMKGCPLRCSWCHNPEGISPEPQVLHGPAESRTVGQWYDSNELAASLNRQADILRSNEGGVTFSGGEPLAQADFVAEVIDQLDRTHIVLDTSGFASDEKLRKLATRVDLVLFDLKLMNSEQHRRYTGCDNGLILRNFDTLTALGVPCVVRVPLVPGVTDTRDNLAAMAEFLRNRSNVRQVELLPYNVAAGGKYGPLGMEFRPSFDATQPTRPDVAVFEARGIKVVVG